MNSTGIDPTTLAAITAAVTVLGTEFAKGVVGEAGKGAWSEIKRLFGWTAEPEPMNLAIDVAKKLQQSPDLAPKVIDLLGKAPAESAAQLVGRVDADNVVIANFVGKIKM